MQKNSFLSKFSNFYMTFSGEPVTSPLYTVCMYLISFRFSGIIRNMPSTILKELSSFQFLGLLRRVK